MPRASEVAVDPIANSAVTRPSPTKTRSMMVASLLAALLAASAWITIPIGAVPVTLQVFVVLLAGLLLSPRWAFAAVSSYVLLGAIGVPVFSGAQGGLGVLAGPTGGYIFGFAAAAAMVAAARGLLVPRAGSRTVPCYLSALLGVIVIYALGWAQLSMVTGMGSIEALSVGVVPFLVPDAVKAAVAVAVAGTLRRSGITFD